jgi:hypothetical protein
MLLSDVEAKLNDIAAWSSLARAAFGTPSRVQSILAAAKTHTFEEAMRQTVVALCLYHRWEPELVHAGEDFAEFRKEFLDKGQLDKARHLIDDALDATPLEAWRPSDAKSKARDLFMRVIEQMEKPAPSTNKRKSSRPDSSAEFTEPEEDE